MYKIIFFYLLAFVLVYFHVLFYFCLKAHCVSLCLKCVTQTKVGLDSCPPFLPFRRGSHPVCRVFWQLQPQSGQPFQWIPDAVTFLTLPALVSRRSYLHRNRGAETREDFKFQHSNLQTGVPVPRGLQCSLGSIYSTAVLCTPHCREETLWFRRNFHQLVFPHC